ncbi:MAG: response regulator [Rubrivivax sp.]|nr:MAG: response regulator [Rubrivivax sp.]
MKFLVVDPLAGVQIFVRQLLQGHGVAAEQIICCANTDAALTQGLAFKPNFIITDWFPSTPLTGPLLYQRLREVQPGLQLALLSFDVTAEHEFEAEAHGAQFLLKKPFTADQLKAQMAKVLGSLPKPAAAAPAAKPARPVLPLIPPQPVLKPGDKVRYQGTVHVTEHVVHRHGETVVQLKGRAAFVPLEKLQLA